MARKLAIANKVLVPVRVVVPNTAGQAQRFDFNLTMDRLSSEEMRAARERDETPLPDFLKKHTHGWDGQRLVLEEDDTPSPFSPEAFSDMLDIMGVPQLILDAYAKEVVARAKN